MIHATHHRVDLMLFATMVHALVLRNTMATLTLVAALNAYSIRIALEIRHASATNVLILVLEPVVPKPSVMSSITSQCVDVLKA